MSAVGTSSPGPFSSREWALSLLLAVVVEAGLVALLVVAGSGGSLHAEESKPPAEIPMAVKPVLDLPLLKLGSKKKPKLPDMWRKPKPKKRYEDKSAPSVHAKKKLDTRPDNKLAKKADEAAPEDIKEEDLAEQVDENVIEDEEDDPNLLEDGAEDGVEDGEETDPLKAFVISQYRLKVIAWFKRGFRSPADRIDCAILMGLKTRAIAQIGPDRSFVSYTIATPSGNAVFDARVKKVLDSKLGQVLPPPPPKYADILSTTETTVFSGKTEACKNIKIPKARSPKPAPEAERRPSLPEPEEEPSLPEPEPVEPDTPEPAKPSLPEPEEEPGIPEPEPEQPDTPEPPSPSPPKVPGPPLMPSPEP